MRVAAASGCAPARQPAYRRRAAKERADSMSGHRRAEAVVGRETTKPAMSRWGRRTLESRLAAGLEP
jgi:hypothetical protein